MTLSELRRGLAMAREHETLGRSYEARIRELVNRGYPLDEDELTNVQMYAESAYWHLKIGHHVRDTLRQAHRA